MSRVLVELVDASSYNRLGLKPWEQLNKHTLVFFQQFAGGLINIGHNKITIY